ncbi:MAG: rod shape-determining protein MreD [Bacillota bacterium]
MRKTVTIVAILLSVFLDSLVFARLGLYGVRPDALLGTIVSFGVLMGGLPAGLIGLAAGLFTDIFFGRFVGLGAAIYLLAGFGGGLFYRKFYADNLIVPSAAAAVAGVAKEVVMAIALALTGVKFSFFLLLVEYILPCAFLSALWCALVHVIFRRVYNGRQSPGFALGAGGRK